MANLQIRIDDSLKNEALAVVEALGIDLSSAVRMFLAQMVKENGFPFLPSNDPFYSAKNMAALRESALQASEKRVVTKSLDELRGME